MMLSVGYEVKKGDSVPYQPYGMERVKLISLNQKDGFITLLHSSRKLLCFQLCRLVKHNQCRSFLFQTQARQRIYMAQESAYVLMKIFVSI
ncbi:hypothetical protein Hanom_Chr04g00285781 [Helianthus anomalus]